jgi:Universal stress protein family
MSGFPEKILLATDGMENTTLAARAAVDLAKKGGAELHVVHVWHTSTPRKPTLKATHEGFLWRALLTKRILCWRHGCAIRRSSGY